jgi:1,2-diacylglycerol 3-beta-galactosyltransferase
MAKYPITWDIFYHFGATPFGLWLNEFLLETFCFEPFKQCLQRPSGTTGKRADMVVSVHPLCQDIPLKILSELDSDGKTRHPSARRTPFSTVVTDLGSAHPAWFNSGVDMCFVPSDALVEAARQRSLVPSQIVQYGLPIRQGFWKSNNTKQKDSLRRELGLDSTLPTVLVVGGGDGMGGIVDISDALAEKMGKNGNGRLTSQLVVVCGNNESACKSLRSMSWGPGVKVHVKGFVNNMDEFMRVSDTLVTKAGPGTIAEASICGLPCMLFSYL